MVTSEGVTYQGWHLDNRATHHPTNAVQNLTDGKPYTSSELLFIGNSKGLSITHVGYIIFIYLLKSYCISPIYYVSFILLKSSLVVFKFLNDNNVIIEFFSNLCYVKNKVKKILLAQGIAIIGLYNLLSQDDFYSNPEVQICQPSSMLYSVSNKFVSNKSVNSISELVKFVFVNLVCCNIYLVSYNTSCCINSVTAQ